MKIARRFALASLLVIAVAVVLGAPAPASGASATYKLYPAADSPFPNASGKVTLAADHGDFLPTAIGVSVSKLAPNASYYVPVTVRVHQNYGGWQDVVYNLPIQTDAHGSGRIAVDFGNSSYALYASYVYDSSGTLVLTSNP